MVEKIDSRIIETVKAYAAEVKKHYTVDMVILFGSFAKGNPHEDSDIDVAIVSNDIHDEFTDGLALMKFRRKIDLRIEPHAINTTEYQNNETALINEIRNTGIQINVA